MKSLVPTFSAVVAYLAPVAVVANSALETEQSPAINRVLTMLNELVSTLDAEGAKDEETFTHFSSWCANQLSETSTSIERLQAEIEETTATLSHLNARKSELHTDISSLKESISVEATQLQTARDKRAEENSVFVIEQQQFEGAISACGKAVEVLRAHYGDGEAAAAEKPAWMALVAEQVATVRRAAAPLAKHQRSHQVIELLQAKAMDGRGRLVKAAGGLRQPSINANRYQDSSGEAGNIVDQVKVLADTFAEDKQSSIEDEARLAALFSTLVEEKTTLLAQLRGDLATKTSIFTQVSQEVAQNEAALGRAEKELTDSQAYLARTTQLRDDTRAAYETRQKDRAAERAAVEQAAGVLRSFLAPSLVQREADRTRVTTRLSTGSVRSSPSAVMATMLAEVGTRPVAGASQSPCTRCTKAAALLRTRAQQSHSELLQAAATTTLGAGNEAIGEIITSLNGIVAQLQEQQKSEDAHKDWCDHELGLTNTKLTDHSSVIDHLTQTLANLKEVLVEEKQMVVDTQQELHEEDLSYEELQAIRETEKTEYEGTHEETVEAIAALNQAIDILAKFYASRGSFLQLRGGTAQQPTAGDGGGVVRMLGTTRSEFEEAREHLEEEEHHAVQEFEGSRVLHVEVDGNLHTDENMEETQVQTTEGSIEQATDDKTAEKEEEVSTKSYLDQLGNSCYTLINNHADRKRRRSEEEQALHDAIDVLKDHA